MANKHLKRCSTSYLIKEVQTKTMRYHQTPIRMTTIWNTDHIKCWRGCGSDRNSHSSLRGCDMVQPLWKSVTVSYKLHITLTLWFSNHLERISILILVKHFLYFIITHIIWRLFSLVFTQMNRTLMSKQKPAQGFLQQLCS